jgi:hypothetical protein
MATRASEFVNEILIRGPGGHTGFSKQYKKQQHLISTSPKIFLQFFGEILF